MSIHLKCIIQTSPHGYVYIFTKKEQEKLPIHLKQIRLMTMMMMMKRSKLGHAEKVDMIVAGHNIAYVAPIISQVALRKQWWHGIVTRPFHHISDSGNTHHSPLTTTLCSTLLCSLQASKWLPNLSFLQSK
jgi:hypothetical protein